MAKNFLKLNNGNFLNHNNTCLIPPTLYGYNQQCYDGNFITTANWTQQPSQTIACNDNKLTTTIISQYGWFNFQQAKNTYMITANHKYLVTFCCVISSSVSYTNITLPFTALNNWTGGFASVNLALAGTSTTSFSMSTLGTRHMYYGFVTPTSTCTTARFCINPYAGWNSSAGAPYTWQVGDSCTGESFCLFDLTEWYGAGNEPSTLQEFKNLFNKDYYSYQQSTEQLTAAQINYSK